MIAYRIADGRHPIFDATGAMLHGGRWNSVGQRVIYAAESYAGAMLEVLVHANLGAPPKNQCVVRISVPDEITVETLEASGLVGWDSEDSGVARRFGDRWLRELRSAVLKVPSMVTEGRESNVLFNPAHPDFRLVVAEEAVEVRWDRRLFQGRMG